MSDVEPVEFDLGEVVMTAGIISGPNCDGKDVIPLDGVMGLIKRHHSGDWGELDEEDKATNKAALKHGSRLMSAYIVDGQKVWVITEADRSVTTVLYPSEY